MLINFIVFFYQSITYNQTRNTVRDGLQAVADLGGGDGGDASPPTSLKVTILAEKSASISNNSAPASPPPT